MRLSGSILHYEKGMELQRDGAQGRNRTTDTAIFSRMLYQLSYLGDRPAERPRGSERGV